MRTKPGTTGTTESMLYQSVQIYGGNDVGDGISTVDGYGGSSKAATDLPNVTGKKLGK